MRRAAKRDTSEAEIIQALEACGFTVTRLSQPNVPDLLLSRPGWCGVARFAAQWPTKVWVLRNTDDVLALANATTHKLVDALTLAKETQNHRT